MTSADRPLHMVGIPREQASEAGIASPGSDIAGRILNERNAARAEAMYQATPVFGPDDVPRGRTAHIGGGVFLSRCPDCDDYVRTFGAVLFIAEFAHGIRQEALLP